MPTVKELKKTLRAHNKAHCVKLSGKKSELVQRVTRLGGGGQRKRSGLAARMAGGLDRPVQVKPPPPPKKQQPKPKKQKKRIKPTNFQQLAANAPEDKGKRLGKAVSRAENMARMRADKKKLMKWREVLQ
jgi:hypothetical protein